MGVVQYIGLKQLGDDAGTVQTLVERYMEKLDRDFSDYTLLFHSKLHNIGGRVKYSFHVRLEHPQMVAKADAVDWDLRRTVLEVMQALEQEVEHTFKIHGQKQERFHPKKAKRGTDTRVKLKLRRRAKLI